MAALIGALDRREEYVAGYAAGSLGSMREAAEPAIPRLLSLSAEKEHPARLEIVESLGEIPSKKYAKTILETLVKLTDDPKAFVQQKSLSALAEIIGRNEEEKELPIPRKTLALRFGRKLASEDANVREEAAEALQSLGPLAAVVLPAVVKGLSDESYSVRYDCLNVLEKIGEASKPAQDAVIRMANDESEEWKSLRSNAVSVLGKMHGDAEKVVPVLNRASRTRTRTRRRSALWKPTENSRRQRCPICCPSSILPTTGCADAPWKRWPRSAPKRNPPSPS